MTTARVLTCRDPACGDGGRRTELGAIANRWLIVPPDAATRYSGTDGRWYVVCPGCGHETAWTGNVGRMERREAA